MAALTFFFFQLRKLGVLQHHQRHQSTTVCVCVLQKFGCQATSRQATKTEAKEAKMAVVAC